ncbi:hypothetical protein [Paraburkholderia sp. SUR17]|uniref:hypothetical protein n=1 Tax=Paraburkholderia sp. SUR17 TaxID=3034358 RepID=UPI002407D92F|nr:hypothetical protein [Paraburkholderia sp. SUR17]WEY37745.1 hypothetical protein P2869_11720 [Paraburkholderia sp. SUR17]
MKAVDTASDEFQQGHIAAGLWDSTMGVAMGAIVDVFTLGGTASPEEGTKTIRTVTNQGGSGAIRDPYVATTESYATSSSGDMCQRKGQSIGAAKACCDSEHGTFSQTFLKDGSTSVGCRRGNGMAGSYSWGGTFKNGSIEGNFAIN